MGHEMDAGAISGFYSGDVMQARPSRMANIKVLSSLHNCDLGYLE